MPDQPVLEALGIDAAEGLAYCADDPEFYEEMLAEYVKESGMNRACLQQFFEDRDWAGYRIRVHSVKNTSRMIGAAELSEQAYVLEKVAKELDMAAIHAGHAPFLAAYTALTDRLREMLGGMLCATG